MLNSIGIKNLRSFVNETNIDIKPITVFVGKNSSGKSSLLRTFPLLRQSVEGNTTGPILWFGRYVDFGDFNQALSNHNVDENPTIDFKFNLSVGLNSRLRHIVKSSSGKTNIEVVVKVVSNKIKTVFHSAVISIFDMNVEICAASDNGELILSNDAHKLKVTGVSFGRSYDFIPEIIWQRKRDDSYPIKGEISKNGEASSGESVHSQSTNNIRPRVGGASGYDSYIRNDLQHAFLSSAAKTAKKYFSDKSSLENIKFGLSRLPMSSLEDFKESLGVVFKSQKTFMKHYKSNAEKIAEELYLYMFGWNLRMLMRIVNINLYDAFTSIKYIAPLRATTERYYRFQDLQVDEIDHTGSNLAMLLNSLRVSEQKDFAAWTKENFGFSVFVKEVGAHYAVKILTNDDEEEYNISDMGFGYSQMLPIIASIWLETERKNIAFNECEQSVFVIEQPELHLHPAYQTKLGELFAKVITKAKQNQSNIKIVFETHSQSIIESLGEMVENGDLGSDDVAIYVFDKDVSGETKVTNSFFNNYGQLKNWPVGFFSGK